MSIENLSSVRTPLIIGGCAFAALAAGAGVWLSGVKSEFDNSQHDIAAANVEGFSHINSIENNNRSGRSFVRRMTDFHTPYSYAVDVALKDGGFCTIYTEGLDQGNDGIIFPTPDVKLVSIGTCPVVNK